MIIFLSTNYEYICMYVCHRLRIYMYTFIGLCTYINLPSSILCKENVDNIAKATTPTVTTTSGRC